MNMMKVHGRYGYVKNIDETYTVYSMDPMTQDWKPLMTFRTENEAESYMIDKKKSSKLIEEKERSYRTKNRRKGSNSLLLLLLVLIVVAAFALLNKKSPLYYENLNEDGIRQYLAYFDPHNQYSPLDESRKITKTIVGSDVERISFENGGFYTYTYQYEIVKMSDDFYAFSCKRISKYTGTTSLCHQKKLSSDGFNALIDDINELIKSDQLYDCTYDSSGFEIDPSYVIDPLRINGNLYEGLSSDELFKSLAINAGVDKSDLEWNERVEDQDIKNRANVDLRGDFVYDSSKLLSGEEKQKIEAYLREKYEATGIRMYVLTMNCSSEEEFKDKVKGFSGELFDRASSDSMSFAIGNQKIWVNQRFTWNMDAQKRYSDRYAEIYDVYKMNNELSYYDRILMAVDKAYEIAVP